MFRVGSFEIIEIIDEYKKFPQIDFVPMVVSRIEACILDDSVSQSVIYLTFLFLIVHCSLESAHTHLSMQTKKLYKARPITRMYQFKNETNAHTFHTYSHEL